MDHSIIPVAWKKVLSDLQTVHPSAILAGGCLRDTICDAPVKDVDIFISDVGAIDTQDVAKKIAKLFDVEVVGANTAIIKGDYIRLEHDFKEKKAGLAAKYRKVDPRYINQETNTAQAALQSYITLIYDMKYNGMLYQLIFVEMDPVPFVEMDFDFGLCKVYFDGNELTITDEFWYDYENKQLTISGHHTASQILHTMTVHRPNITKKYPGWKVVVEDVRLRTEDEMPPSYKRIAAGWEAAQRDIKQAKQDVMIELASARPNLNPWADKVVGDEDISDEHREHIEQMIETLQAAKNLTPEQAATERVLMKSLKLYTRDPHGWHEDHERKYYDNGDEDYEQWAI
jgi:hypothetical protein